MANKTLNSLQFPGLSDTYKIPPQAQEFSSSSTYAKGMYVTYQGLLYKCTTAVTTAGAWTGNTNWTQVDVGDELEDLDARQIVETITEDDYDDLSTAQKNADILYAIIDDEPPSDTVYSKSQVDGLVQNIKNDLTSIFATGTSNTTGSVITNGTYFYLNNVLVRAIIDIGNDVTFSLNVNYEEVTAGGLNELVESRLPKIGMGENLLRNWYWVNPVNQRGQSSYTFTTASYGISAWKMNRGTITLTSSGITCTWSGNTSYQTNIQVLENYDAISGKRITMSALRSDGTLYTDTFTVASSGSYVTASGSVRFSASATSKALGINIASTAGITITAIKAELGTEQTLAHLEGSIWVLNEIPDYEAELLKCQTSTADSSDTYANKTLATEQQLAYVETGTTASRAYSIGEYFCWNGLLYRAKTAISSGDSFTVGTNCVAISSGGLNDLKGVFASVSGTLSNGDWFSNTVAYPSGFSSSTALLISLNVAYSNEWRSGTGVASSSHRTFASMKSNGIAVYNDDPALYGATWSVVLYKF